MGMKSNLGTKGKSRLSLGAIVLSFGFYLALSILFSILLPQLLETFLYSIKPASKVLAAFEICYSRNPCRNAVCTKTSVAAVWMGERQRRAFLCKEY
ncbi:MAG: hypothetical protein LBU41_06120, partial [Clostridiales Family XIII bacterium]|nr:hypothetical protein [Clostridiales Family XIII bacterium]